MHDLVDEFAAAIPEAIDIKDVRAITELLCQLAYALNVRLTDLERQLDDIILRATLNRLARMEDSHAA